MVPFFTACLVVHAGELSVREASLAKLREAFSYTAPQNIPVSKEAESIKEPSDSDVIHMDPFLVTESAAGHNLAKAFEDKAALDAERAFSVKKGGLIMTKKIGNVEAEFGIWTSLAPPVAPAGLPILRVDILHLRW